MANGALVGPPTDGVSNPIWLDRWGWDRLGPSQRSRHHLAVHCLPFPLNVAFLMIILHHHSIHLLPHTGFVPGLKPLVQTAAGTIPFLLQSFPLAATPQHKQDPVHHLAVRQSGRPPLPAGFSRGKSRSIFSHSPSGISHSVV